METAKLRILVWGIGFGIPEGRRADIFENFTQVDGGSSCSRGGTGARAGNLRNLVGLMGERISLESRSGEGSTLWFEVSLGTRQGEAEPLPPDCTGSASWSSTTGRRSSPESCRPETAASGAEALAGPLSSQEDGSFRLILIAQETPGMAGEQVARDMKADHRHAAAPLVLLSSLGSPGRGEDLDPGLY